MIFGQGFDNPYTQGGYEGCVPVHRILSTAWAARNLASALLKAAGPPKNLYSLSVRRTFAAINQMFVLCDEFIQLSLQFHDNLERRVDEFLVYAKAVPLKIYVSCECHHSIVNLSAMMPRKELVSFFPPDERAGMKNKRLRIKS